MSPLNSYYSPLEPTASITNIWVETGVRQLSKSGIKIHFSMTINYARNQRIRAVAYFYYASDGSQVYNWSNNIRYYTTSNGACTDEDFTSIYDSSSWNDFTLFMPDDEMAISSGTSTHLKLDIGLFYYRQDSSRQWFYTSYQYYFTYYKPLPPPPVTYVPPITYTPPSSVTYTPPVKPSTYSNTGATIGWIVAGIAVITIVAIMIKIPVGIIITIGLGGLAIAINFNQ